MKDTCPADDSYVFVPGRKEGRKEGSNEGRKEATKEGRKEGRKEATKEGRKEATKEGRKEARKQRRKEGRKQRRKEGSKKKAKKRDELGVSHFYFQAFPSLQAFAPSCDYHTSWCSLWLSRPWFLRVAPAATATASGGRRCALPPNPPPALLDV